MENLYIFVDGSNCHNGEVHSGAIVIFKNKIILESYSKVIKTSGKKDSHEQFAILSGLNLIKDMCIDKELVIHFYSDDKNFVKLVNDEMRRKRDFPFEEEMKQKVLTIENDIYFHWCKNDQSLWIKRAHDISRKWKDNLTILDIDYVDTDKFLIQEVQLEKNVERTSKKKQSKSILFGRLSKKNNKKNNRKSILFGTLSRRKK